MVLNTKIAISLVVFVLSTSFSSCGTRDPKTIVVEVPCSEIQKNEYVTIDIAANVGDVITIELCSYLTMDQRPTDYRWQYRNQWGTSGPIVREKSYELGVSKGEGEKTGEVDVGIEGSSEKPKWIFEVIGKGNNIIRMDYARHQLGVEEINRTYSMNITVK